MRRPHYLRPNKTTTRPSRVVFVDTETEPYITIGSETIHRLKLGYAIFARTRRNEYLRVQSDFVISDIGEFWRWVDGLVKDKTVLHFVSHNLVFDLPILHAFQELPALGWELLSFYSKNAVNIFRWRNDKRKILMVDNGNFFAGKLERWGTIVGYPKLSVDFDTVSDDDLLTYCQRDTEILVHLWRYWLRFLDENDCGDFRITVGSTAFNAYRHRFMPTKIHVHDDANALDLERASYRGGRVAVFKVGEFANDTFYYLDINSMYPFVMATNDYPTRLLGVYDGCKVSSLERRLMRYCAIATVDIATDAALYPCMVDGVLAYPVGEFVTTLTTPELKTAIERGDVARVGKVAFYRKRPIFADFVGYFYNRRLQYASEGNEPMTHIVKLMLNSLYGKFGQRGYRQAVIGETDATVARKEHVINPITNSRFTIVVLGGSVFKFWNEGESYNSFPAIAAHVTAYARSHLMTFVARVTPGHVYYCDTDSLIVDSIGYRDLQPFIDVSALGGLKVEHVANDLAVYAPKDYAMGERIKRKGIRADAEQVSNTRFRQVQFVRLDGMIDAGKVRDYMTRVIEKELQRKIRTGRVNPMGDVEPFQVRLLL